MTCTFDYTQGHRACANSDDFARCFDEGRPIENVADEGAVSEPGKELSSARERNESDRPDEIGRRQRSGGDGSQGGDIDEMHTLRSPQAHGS